MRSWRLALRVARRDALRARGRSLLVLVMIALPVAAVAIADTVYSTSQVSGGEVLERRLGGAAALVEAPVGGGQAYQKPDPGEGQAFEGGGRSEPLTAAGIEEVLGPRPTAVLDQGRVRFETELGLGDADVLETRLDDPLAAGLVDLVEGRWPADTSEVVVSPELLERGPGDALTLEDGSRLSIVGTARSARYTGQPRAFGLPGAFGLGRDASRQYLVGGDPVTWDQVLELNAVGATVLSRAVMNDPPAGDELPMEVQWGSDLLEASVITVLVLVVVMVLLEVVLLAGPAFAVGARRQARTLALMAAAGGTPAQARRVVLASGVVLGAVAAVLGVLLGLLGALALMPLVQRFSATRFGPFDVTWTHLLVVAGFGLFSALLAAVVPAWLASRQDVVAVLNGRRGDARASRRSPLVGLVLLGAGLAAAVWGARTGTGDGGEIAIAASALLSVLGMVLLVPVVVVAVARLARGLPLPLRFAARDAARHRSRTVPAVAAVAATVAGVVALGIAVTSDEAQNRETYTATLPMDAVSVVDYRRRADYDLLEATVAGVAPDLEVRRLDGVDPDEGRWTDVQFRRTGGESVLSSYGGSFSSSVLVADEVPGPATGLSDSEREAADRTLAAGGVLAYVDAPVADDEAVVVLRVRGPDARRERAVLPATFVVVEQGYAPLQGVLSEAAAERLAAPVREVGLYLPGPVPAGQERDIREVVGGAAPDASVYAERGYQADDGTVVVQLVLAGLGAVLMLGGTLTATFLALSDARPDLATLSAVGATPRTRRGVAAAYALVVGLVGAVLGALVGAVPGVAITYPLTAPYGFGEGAGGPSHYLDVPWLLVLGVVVGLPLLTSAVVGLTARSRLPLVARLE
ncbi:FtsX-like permease family protein [Nocardioides sp. 31GB23]|uniref:ABC transporter permease n=1 Tax=Nocardioides sp. 31GB23 TaxID=3156065 RepID=UPI0032AF567D